MIQETTCPITVAIAPPATPISNTKMKIGSNIKFKIAPETKHIIEYFGEKVNTKAFKILQLDMIIILAGAIGNCIDRVTKGYVVDYFYFKLIDFPVFNVADCYITVAVAVMLIMCFFVLKDKELDYFMGSKKKWQVEDESK